MAGPGTPLPQRLAVAERRAKVLELKVAGWTLDRIVAEGGLGYKSRAQVSGDISRALKAIIRPGVDQVRDLALERLEGMLAAVYPDAINRSSDKQHGAIDRVLRILQQQARYLPVEYERDVELPISADGSVTITFSTPAPGGRRDPQVVDLPPLEET